MSQYFSFFFQLERGICLTAVPAVALPAGSSVFLLFLYSSLYSNLFSCTISSLFRINLPCSGVFLFLFVLFSHGAIMLKYMYLYLSHCAYQVFFFLPFPPF